MEIKLLLLDFDGTVANTGRANATSYIEALAEEGITITMEEYRRKYFGLRCPEFLTDIGITDPVQMQRIRRRKVEIYPTHFDLVTLNKPLWDFVQDFRAKGGKAMIVSTHDLELALRLADKIWLMNNGALTEGNVKSLSESGALQNFIDDNSIVYNAQENRIEIRH